MTSNILPNNSDRELLEMAAKAAGYTIADWCETRAGVRPSLHDTHAPGRWVWDPINDDGDRYRLAHVMGFTVDFHFGVVRDKTGEILASSSPEFLDRAIVRAAAAIGAAK